MKTKSLLIFILCWTLSAFGVENSIIPWMDKVEVLENLPESKYSKNQFAEIKEALSHQAERVRLVTYNVLDHTYDSRSEPANRWPQRLPRILALIDEMQPDIIDVQEVFASQETDLLEHLDETYTFYATPSPKGELNGIFYRTNRFEAVDCPVEWRTFNSKKSVTNNSTVIKLKDRLTGKLFAVVNTHLTFSNIETREAEAHAIQEYADSLSLGMPVIVTGDLNTFPHRLDLEKIPFYDGDYIHHILTRGTLRDARDVSLLGHLGPISSFTNATDNAIPFTGTGTPGVLLDHIYVSEGVTVLLHAVQPGTVDGHYPSDHMPVLIDFFLN